MCYAYNVPCTVEKGLVYALSATVYQIPYLEGDNVS